MRMLKTLAIGLSGAAMLAACSTPPKPVETVVVPAKAKAKPVDVAVTPSDPRSVGTVNTGSASGGSMSSDKNGMTNHSIYFDFDSYVLKPEAGPIVTANSKYLAGSKASKVLIQGNTDERGGSEYNLALGQKRAEAVRKALVLMGVPSTQLEAVSFGKEKPKALGSDEAAWAENRRADIVYPK